MPVVNPERERGPHGDGRVHKKATSNSTAGFGLPKDIESLEKSIKAVQAAQKAKGKLPTVPDRD